LPEVADLRIELFRRFREFMLAQPGDEQRLVYRGRVYSKVG
jgi:hypothetical protein